MKKQSLLLSCAGALAAAVVVGCSPASQKQAEASTEVETAPAASANAKEELEGSLVKLEGGKVVPVAAGSLSDVKVLAVYYSAHWCPPCRAFTPRLVEFYNGVKKQHPEFELVFMSSDESPEQMKKYLEEDSMPWPAVAYDKRGNQQSLQQLSAQGIPYLVVLDENGKQILGKGPGEDWKSPMEVLEQLQALLKG
jgi:nucleoredoxin